MSKLLTHYKHTAVVQRRRWRPALTKERSICALFS